YSASSREPAPGSRARALPVRFVVIARRRIAPMIEFPPPAWSRFLVLAALGGVAGCGGGGGGSSGLSAGVAISSCSLSCSDSAGNPGAQVSCGVTTVKVNQELRVTFTSAIDPLTVTNNTFQMIEIGTGKTPAGVFALDSNDARTLIYRPQLT